MKELIKAVNKHNMPPKARTGKCRICNGIITEEYKFKHTGRGEIKYGGSNQFNWVSSGLSCQDCGISYARLPKCQL